MTDLAGAERPVRVSSSMHALASTRAAMAGLMAEAIEDHVRTHLVESEKHPDALNQGAAEELLAVVRTCLK